MIICLDVHYKKEYAQVGAVLFHNWKDEQSVRTKVIKTALAGKYEPGQFYKRELPALLAMLNSIEGPLEYILVDSYVYLGKDKPGLGYYLSEVLEHQTPIIGLAKTPFRGAQEIEVAINRGSSKKPLFVTTIGVDTQWAAGQIIQMHGDYRLPTLVKLADSLSKNEL